MSFQALILVVSHQPIRSRAGLCSQPWPSEFSIHAIQGLGPRLKVKFSDCSQSHLLWLGCRCQNWSSWGWELGSSTFIQHRIVPIIVLRKCADIIILYLLLLLCTTPLCGYAIVYSTRFCSWTFGLFPCIAYFYRWLSGKESACQCRRCRFDPGSGRSPGEGNGDPLQYSCLKNPIDRAAWWATGHGVAKSETQLSTHTCRHVPYIDL